MFTNYLGGKLTANYSSYSSSNLLHFYVLIHRFANRKLADVQSGKVKEFYETTDYQSMALCVNIPEDTSDHITIHKAKGNQFDNVFVIGADNIKEFLLEPDLEKEEHRVAYVAFSRAKEQLFIQFDSSNFSYNDKITLMENMIRFKSFGFDVLRNQTRIIYYRDLNLTSIFLFSLCASKFLSHSDS